MATGQDTTYSGQSKIYIKQQPAGTTMNGSTVTTEEVADTGSLLSMFGQQALNGQVIVGKVSFTFAANGANVSKCSIQFLDNAGNAIARTDGGTATAPTVMDADVVLALSTGVITTLTPSTGLSVVTGTSFQTYVAGKAIYVHSNAAGLIEVNITDTGKQGFYVMVQGGTLPVPQLSRQMVTGDYG
jgi:hypothetical protein